MTKKSESDMLTKTFFMEQIGSLDRKIEGVQQNAKEHLEAVEDRLNKKIDKLDMKIDAVHDKLNNKMETVREELGEFGGKMDRIAEKVEQHDKDIILLKAVG